MKVPQSGLNTYRGPEEYSSGPQTFPKITQTASTMQPVRITPEIQGREQLVAIDGDVVHVLAIHRGEIPAGIEVRTVDR